MIKILALPRYEDMAASSRYRFYQYIPLLERMGYKIDVHPLLKNEYVNFLYHKTPFNKLSIVKYYLNRVSTLLQQNKYDIVWVQQELFPWIPAILEKALYSKKTKLVSDFDDAFFHRYDKHKFNIVRKLLGRKIDCVMMNSDLILAGNKYISDRALKSSGKLNIKIFPTVVDVNKYKLKTNYEIKKALNIVWIGNPGTEKYLKIVEKALEILSAEYSIKLNLIGAKNFHNPKINYNIIQWKYGIENSELSKYDVGIMPLKDSPWERGKCGFKLIQYMASGIPVVGTPIGVNNEIIIDYFNGIQANSTSDWVNALKFFIFNYEKVKEFGINGRKFVEENFSLEMNVNKLDEYFKELMK